MTELVVLAVERERLVFRPRLHDHVVRFFVLVARERGDLAVAEVGVHRRADGEAGDEAPARDDIQHRELFGDANGWVVAGDGVADHAQRGPARAPAERRRDEIGRRHEAVPVLMVFVAADPVESERLRVLELIEIGVVDVMPFLGVVKRIGDIDPYAAVFFAEVVGEVGPGHQVEPGELHHILRPALGRVPYRRSVGSNPKARPPTGAIRHRP